MNKTITLRVPDIGDCESIEVLKWNIQEGQNFEKDSELCDLVSDKATFSLTAPQQGTVTKIHISEGKNVKINDILCDVQI